MSYDVTLYKPIYSSNHTYNCSEMFKSALGYNLTEIDGKLSEDVYNDLKCAIEDMEMRPKYYKKMNPSNGWGSYITALQFLKNLYLTCKENPESIIEIS